VFRCRASIFKDGTEHQITGEGNGPIAAFVHALCSSGVPSFEVVSYREQSLSSGSEASALAYLQIRREDGATCWGAGIDTNIELASIKGVVSAVNRALQRPTGRGPL
jgi:2-isopropylmalate synthase